MNQVKARPTVTLWRKSTAALLTGLGLWVLSLTTPLPQMEKYLEKTVNHPTFLEHSFRLSEDYENDFTPITNFILSRWAWLEMNEVNVEPLPSSQPQDNGGESQLLPSTPQPVVKEEIQNDPQPSQTIHGDWIPRTMLPASTNVQVGDIYVANTGKVSIQDFSVPTSSPVSLEKESFEPQILIYHSHGTESYSPTEGFEYEESDPYRTLQEGRNIITVGEAMVEVFEEAGYGVLHDKSYHDYPDYNASYGNSGEALAHYLEEYPSISLIFDVHRDALEDSSGTPYQLISRQGNTEIAQVMLVVGSNGDGYSHPNWRENFSLALSIQQNLLNYGDFARPVTLRSSRFNQHLSTGALLVEVGGHGNTLEQAVQAGKLFAQSVVETLNGGLSQSE